MHKAERPVVLGVDDTAENLLALGHLLGDDFQFCVATGGIEALEVLKERTPDIVLLDVMMPDLSGFEVCEAMKADPLLRDIPVVFVTALNDAESEERGLALGAVDFIKKPFHPALTRQRIVNHLERELLRQQVQKHNEELEWQVRERTLGLRIAKEAAEAADKLKTTILRNMSHEFRTPLNGVLGMLSLARDRCVDPALRPLLDKGATAGDRLNVVLKKFIDLASTETGTLALELRPFVLDSLFAHLERVAKAAASKGLNFVCEPLPPELAGLRVNGDAGRIGQILNELLDNAVKFSVQGEIRLAVQALRLDAQHCTLRITVSDQGIGISPVDLPRIFTPFLQVDGSETRRQGGNGIGLGLSDRLAQMMGGRLSVRSQLESGSTFILELALTRAGETPEVANDRGDLAQYLREHFPDASVLIADDDQVTLDFLHEITTGIGMSVVCVSDGQSALEAAQTAQFDVVMLDVMMPSLSGLDVAGALRRLPGYARTPLIAITARNSHEAHEASFEAGFDHHLPKPVAADSLLALLADLLDQTNEKLACTG